jgi:hypothetical protein
MRIPVLKKVNNLSGYYNPPHPIPIHIPIPRRKTRRSFKYSILLTSYQERDLTYGSWTGIRPHFNPDGNSGIDGNRSFDVPDRVHVCPIRWRLCAERNACTPSNQLVELNIQHQPAEPGNNVDHTRRIFSNCGNLRRNGPRIYVPQGYDIIALKYNCDYSYF